jgi:hypothetical protein
MAHTFQSVVDIARIPLNDADKTRYPDDTLLSFANQAILTLANRRPDLFIGQFNSLPQGEAALSDAFPLEPVYETTVGNYVTALAEMVDDESANSGRAAAFMQLLNAEVPG